MLLGTDQQNYYYLVAEFLMTSRSTLIGSPHVRVDMEDKCGRLHLLR